MTTAQDFFINSTPLNKFIVKEIGLVKGAVACKIIYAANLRDTVCRMGQRRMAEELGLDKSTVSRTITSLLDDGYLNLIRVATDTTPAYLRPSEKLMKLLDPPVAECNPPVAECNPPVAECNPPVAECNQDKNQIRESNNPLLLSVNGNQPVRDYLSDIQAKAQSGVSESTAPNPQDQYWQYRGDALKAAQSVGFTIGQVDKEDICELIKEPTFNLQTWQLALKETARHYSGGGKIARAIEVYRTGGTYATWREKNYPQQQKGNYNGTSNFGRNNQSGTKPAGRIIPQSVGLGELAFPPTTSDTNSAGT